MLQGESLADAQRYRYLSGRAVHGIYVTEVDHYRFIAQMHQGHIGQIKVDALEQQVGGDKGLSIIAVMDDGTVISHASAGGFVAYRK